MSDQISNGNLVAEWPSNPITSCSSPIAELLIQKVKIASKACPMYPT